MNKFEELARLKELEAKDDSTPWIYTDQGDKARIWGPDGDEVATVWDNNLGMNISAEPRARSISGLHNAAPWLIKIAEAFQPGDATILRLLAEFLEHFTPDGHLNDEGDGAGITNARAADCLRRLQAAAEEMER